MPDIYTSQTKTILVIGCGRMGGAIINGWLRDGINPESIHVIDRNVDVITGLVEKQQVVGYTSIDQIEAGLLFDFVLLALKPQMASDVLPLYRPFIGPASLLISIAAGLTNNTLSKLAPGMHGTVRVMPNTPALVNKGVMVGCTNENVSEAQKKECERLFSTLGNFFWLDEEEKMHAVTAVSGSGPAYLFHFVECMVEAANKAGLPADLSRQLAIGTVVGAAHLVEVDTRAVAELRQEVTSPRGTTEAALNVLMGDRNLSKLLCKAVEAAVERSDELSKA